ncbi:MAG: T9SS type A sorting domain-containing protein [Bacteroidetes bacterium]|nr:T9SS type A sorting domain-containing protein [Bacteroidota bacterium]
MKPKSYHRLAALLCILVSVLLQAQQIQESATGNYPGFPDRPPRQDIQPYSGADMRELWTTTARSYRIFSTAQQPWSYIGPGNANALCGAGRVNCVAVDPLDSNTIWLGSASGGLWKSSNAGLAWTPVSDFFASLGVTKILYEPLNPQTIYLATGDANGGDAYSFGLLKSTDGGVTWDSTALSFTLQANEYIRDFVVHPSLSGHLVVLTNRYIYRSTDGGATFNSVLTGDFYSVVRDPQNAALLYATSYPDVNYAYARIRSSNNNGLSWSFCDIGLPPVYFKIKLAVSPAQPGYLFAAGIKLGTDSMNVIQTSDGGQTWFSAPFHNIGQQTWFNLYFDVSQSQPLRYYFGAVWSWKSTDAGFSWNTMSQWAPVHCDHHGILQTGNGRFFDCNDGGIWKTNDDGATWINLNNNLGALQFYRMDVCKTDTSVIGAGAQDNCYVVKSQGTGNNWHSDVGGDIMEVLIDPVVSNNHYVMGIGGAMAASATGGANWYSIPASNSPLPVWTGYWVTPFAMNPQNTRSFIAGFTEVWKSNDACMNWVPLSSALNNGNNLNCVAFAPSDTNVIYATDFNRFYATFNSGQNWQNYSAALPAGVPVHRVFVHPQQPLEVWLVCGGYLSGSKIYKSVNGGASWINLSAGLPNIQFNCGQLTADAQNTVFLGSSAGMYMLADSLSGWVKMQNGFPNANVSDIEFVPAVRTVFCSTYGRGMWKFELPAINTGLPAGNDAGIVSVFPSPASDHVQVYFSGSFAQSSSLVVFDAFGRQIFSQAINRSAVIATSDWASGLYFFQLEVGGRRIVRQVAISH